MDTEIPIIRMELDGMRRRMISAMALDFERTNAALDKQLKQMIGQFDFEAAVKAKAENIFQEQVRITVQNVARNAVRIAFENADLQELMGKLATAHIKGVLEEMVSKL